MVDLGIYGGFGSLYFLVEVHLRDWLVGVGIGWSVYDFCVLRIRLMDRSIDIPDGGVYIVEIGFLGASIYLGYLEPDAGEECNEE